MDDKGEFSPLICNNCKFQNITSSFYGCESPNHLAYVIYSIINHKCSYFEMKEEE